MSAEKLFEITEEEKPIHKIKRKIWVLSMHEEEFEIPAEDETSAQTMLNQLMNNEEYERFKYSSKVLQAFPYIKHENLI